MNNAQEREVDKRNREDAQSLSEACTAFMKAERDYERIRARAQREIMTASRKMTRAREAMRAAYRKAESTS